jgi:hypothetical protein
MLIAEMMHPMIFSEESIIELLHILATIPGFVDIINRKKDGEYPLYLSHIHVGSRHARI